MESKQTTEHQLVPRETFYIYNSIFITDNFPLVHPLHQAASDNIVWLPARTTISTSFQDALSQEWPLGDRRGYQES